MRVFTSISGVNHIERLGLVRESSGDWATGEELRSTINYAKQKTKYTQNTFFSNARRGCRRIIYGPTISCFGDGSQQQAITHNKSGNTSDRELFTSDFNQSPYRLYSAL
jgi:hypothetical protein